MAQVCADPSAEVKTDPTGLFISAAVASCIAFFKDARQILRRDPDAGIFDTQRLRLFFINSNRSGRRIFQCIGEYLTDDEEEPFFIRKNLQLQRLIDQAQLFSNEHGRIHTHCLTHDPVKLIFSDHIIRCSGIQPQIAHHHIRILVYAGDFFF